MVKFDAHEGVGLQGKKMPSWTANGESGSGARALDFRMCGDRMKNQEMKTEKKTETPNRKENTQGVTAEDGRRSCSFFSEVMQTRIVEIGQ